MKDKKYIFLTIIGMAMALIMISAIFAWKKTGNTPVSSETLPVIHEYCKNSIVQIQTKDFWGSGVVYDMTEEEILILTNRHVVSTVEKCDVIFAQGFYYEGLVKTIYDDHDLALVAVSKETMDPEDLDAVSTVREVAQQDELEIGDRLYLYGSASYPTSHYYGAQLLDVEIEVPDMGDSFLVGLLNEDQEWGYLENGSETAVTLIDGLSGSPVFEEHGKLVGILVGGNDKTFVSIPVWHITAENGLSR